MKQRNMKHKYNERSFEFKEFLTYNFKRMSVALDTHDCIEAVIYERISRIFTHTNTHLYNRKEITF